ncbi:MAG: DUF935 family protein, partial [Bacteroidales bacterium]
MSKKTNAKPSAIPTHQQRREGYVSKMIPKAVSMTRNDISHWKNALKAAKNIDAPRRAKLYNLYNDILLDAHLSSQMELRFQHTLSVPFVLKNADGNENEEATTILDNAPWVNQLNRYLLESLFFGSTLVEFVTNPLTGTLEVVLVPRNNVVPEKGLLLFSEDDTKGLEYRNLREFGTWIVEFGQVNDLGLLNKAVPHVLMKRFAQTCWSELCEIYGIPPRYMKTDTQDPAMLDRAETMLREMGSAAWFIIDSSEAFEFAKGADTNGDVYNNLIRLCKEEISLLISGAVIGQDTKNGNFSKEESSVKLLNKIARSDRKLLATYW